MIDDSNDQNDLFRLWRPFTAPKAAESIYLRKIKVLLVDDVPDNVALVCYILEKVGAIVETACNGQEGVEKATEGQFDVILMDIQMPQLNGYEATLQLRKRGYTKPIIALTAHAMKEDRGKCMDSGCNDYLAKPVVRPLLIQTIYKNLASSAAPPFFP